MTASISTYAVYRTVAADSEAVGSVVNRINWDGSSPYSPGDGLALIADPDGKYPIGSIYSPPAASS
ncbi:hypothetical protein [Acetobacter estunensis]|uniref:hypothetical protein n=1 Tax=Acetobacter estunensis TaxID=104097 RepID=UPI001C2CFCAD|nr:hypothetical protein [Acetobacter estunensis]MBV1835667.1 hypothetical protein [Acetobacter estunensis]MBV1836072.1 hypothetical protein [Acetobacter estunensis]